METKSDVGQIIYTVKERNRLFHALKEIEYISSGVFDPKSAKENMILIGDLCKRAMSSRTKIRSEVSHALSRLRPR